MNLRALQSHLMHAHGSYNRVINLYMSCYITKFQGMPFFTEEVSCHYQMTDST